VYSRIPLLISLGSRCRQGAYLGAAEYPNNPKSSSILKAVTCGFLFLFAAAEVGPTAATFAAKISAFANNRSVFGGWLGCDCGDVGKGTAAAKIVKYQIIYP
jgi:hypothetical protein